MQATAQATADRVVGEFVEAAKSALGDQLKSVVLYGTAAEGKLRATSDVNAIAVLSAWDPARVDALRGPMRTAHAAVDLNVMFLLERELPAATEAFGAKFADVINRRKVVFGSDPFAGVTVSRAAEVHQLRQVLLNLALRLRQRYALASLRDEQLAALVADTAGPLRSSAATLLALQGKPAPSPKEALAQVAAALGGDWAEVLARLSQAREEQQLAPGVGAPTVLKLIELAAAMQQQAMALGTA